MADVVERELESQVALVTGGGRGIGRNVAIELAEAGATVIVSARSTDEIEETARLAGAQSQTPRTRVTGASRSKIL